MPLTFGTSGLRGLVSALDDATVAGWTRAYLAALPPAGPLFVGRDLRPSSRRIAMAVLASAEAAGVATIDCGVLPTPALAAAADGAAAIMVTGSHIAADRNGLKFYSARGEIGKQDETAIAEAKAAAQAPAAATPAPRRRLDALSSYAQRYIGFFGPSALAGLRIGLWQHSSAARDVLGTVLAGLGAEVVAVGRSKVFVPLDTEAIAPRVRARIAQWCATHRLDALVSADGDGDRPLLADAAGRIVPGDVLGVLAARALGADLVVTPVSSNSIVAALFPDTRLTRIGSPCVLAAMAAAQAENPAARVVGFEANGGFILGFAAQGPVGPLAPLLTRDALLPLLAPLAAARAAGHSIAAAAALLPGRFTATDRLLAVAPLPAKAFLAQLEADAAARAAFLAELGREVGIDRTDGLRMHLAGGAILHLRPSGNAPEFRVYAEAESPAAAQALLRAALAKVRAALG